MTVDFGRSPFELVKFEHHAVLKLIGDMVAELAKEYDRRIRAQVEGLGMDLVVDLTEAGIFHVSWTRLLMQLVAAGKQNGKHVIVLTTDPLHKAFLSEQGISASLPVAGTMESAVQYLTARRAPKLDVNIVNAFLSGVIDVMRVQVHMIAKPAAPAALALDAPTEEHAAALAFSSTSFNGSFVIAFPRKTYFEVLSLMTGREHVEITPDVEERVVEIMSTIGAYTKRIGKDRGINLRVTTAVPLSPPRASFDGRTVVLDKTNAGNPPGTLSDPTGLTGLFDKTALLQKTAALDKTAAPTGSEDKTAVVDQAAAVAKSEEKTAVVDKTAAPEQTASTGKTVAPEQTGSIDKTGVFEKTGVIDRTGVIFKPTKRIAVRFESDAGPFTVEIRF